MAVPDHPAIVCTLGAEAAPDRLREWQVLLARAESRRAASHGIRLRFPRDPELLGALASLVTREVECCSFFTFTMTVDAGAAWLTITAPDDASSLVMQLFGPVGTPPRSP